MRFTLQIYTLSARLTQSLQTLFLINVKTHKKVPGQK